MDIKRYYTNNHGPDKTNEEYSFQFACFLSKALGVNNVTIVIPTKSTTSYFERIFDKDISKKLFEGIIIDGVRVKLETKSTLKNFPIKRVLLTYGLHSDKLFQYDSLSEVIAIVGHQEDDGDLKEWAEKWNAKDILSDL